MYLNSRGCVIPKSSVTEKEIETIKSDLTVVPKENHAIKLVQSQEKKVIVFRENEQKL